MRAINITAIICCAVVALCTAGSPDLLDLAILRLADHIPLCEKMVSPVEGVILE